MGGSFGAFQNCNKITNAPTIPESVTNINSIFKNCKALTGTVTINANTSTYDSCFAGVDFETQNLTLSGTSTELDTYGATGTNYCTECNGKCQGTH